MFKKKSPTNLSTTELRRLLIDKRRSERQERLERFRETGRVVTLVSGEDEVTWEEMHTKSLADEDAVPDEGKKRGKWVMDGGLLLVEILAVVGLIFILFNGMDILQELNREVAIALEQPTFTPTPLVQVVVLPSGHTSPETVGGSQFNKAEIPAHLLPSVQSYLEIPVPTQSPGQAIRLQIPALGQDVPIVEGDGWEQLKKGVGHHVGSANPGQIGNVVLSAHNDIYGEIFRELDKLEPGDEVIVFTERESFTYVVTEHIIVEPTQVDVMDATNDATVTLISCYPYLVDNKRIVVFATLKTD